MRTRLTNNLPNQSAADCVLTSALANVTSSFAQSFTEKPTELFSRPNQVQKNLYRCYCVPFVLEMSWQLKFELQCSAFCVVLITSLIKCMCKRLNQTVNPNWIAQSYCSVFMHNKGRNGLYYLVLQGAASQEQKFTEFTLDEPSQVFFLWNVYWPENKIVSRKFVYVNFVFMNRAPLSIVYFIHLNCDLKSSSDQSCDTSPHSLICMTWSWCRAE